MKPERVDQLLAGFAEGDAISREASVLRDVLRGMGVESEIFAPADGIGKGVVGCCKNIDAYAGAPTDVAVYHYSTASVATQVFLDSPARKIVRYHNITPAHFFDGLDDASANELRKARSELLEVVSKADRVCAVSEFNAGELRALGADRVSVIPLFFSIADFDATPDRDTLEKFGDRLKNILFVGRIAPNKRVEELILAFAWHNTFTPTSRLILVGSEWSCPRYYAMLRILTGRLGLYNVYFAGFVSDAQLAAYYARGDVFVTASRHEGYCLPLIEAMGRGVPVIARDTGGMPEALGGGGVLFDDAEPRELAELIQRILTDNELRAEILASQTRRIEEIRRRDLSKDCRLLAGLQ